MVVEKSIEKWIYNDAEKGTGEEIWKEKEKVDRVVDI